MIDDDMLTHQQKCIRCLIKIDLLNKAMRFESCEQSRALARHLLHDLIMQFKQIGIALTTRCELHISLIENSIIKGPLCGRPDKTRAPVCVDCLRLAWSLIHRDGNSND